MKDLIVSIRTTNEYSDTDMEYARIERSPQILAKVKAAVEHKKLAPNVLFVSYMDGFEELTSEVLNIPEWQAVMGEHNTPKQDYVFADLPDNDDDDDTYHAFDAPMDCHEMRVSDNSIKWLCWGKHVGDEYWTEDVLIEEFLSGVTHESVSAVPYAELEIHFEHVGHGHKKDYSVVVIPEDGVTLEVNEYLESRDIPYGQDNIPAAIHTAATSLLQDLANERDTEAEVVASWHEWIDGDNEAHITIKLRHAEAPQ